jgi:ABC-type nitrate/sulfonate/bicarbonate transport system substrate-binding protein
VASRGRFLAGASTFAVAATLPSRAPAEATRLRVVFFPGADAWPLYVAQERGFFSAEGLDVATTPTPGSVYQIAHLMAGDFDIAMTAFDNLVAYDEGQGDPSVAGPFDLVAFLGGGEGALKLVTRPEIRGYADLRGKPLAVDALATGFSFVLRKMLALAGLGANEYTLVPVGNTERRFAAMVAGTCAAAMVATPFEFLGAERHGFTVLGSAIDALGHYQANCGVVRRSWGERNRDALAAYTRGYRGALRWLFDPRNREAAVAILARNARLDAALAARSASVLLDPHAGLSPDATLDRAGIATVLALRTAYATPKKQLNDPAKYLAPWLA